MPNPKNIYRIDRVYHENGRIMFSLDNGASVYGLATFSMDAKFMGTDGQAYYPYGNSPVVEYLCN